MIWIILLICLVFALGPRSGPKTKQPVGDAEPLLETYAFQKPIRNPYYRHKPDTLEGIGERTPHFLGVLASELFQLTTVCIWQIAKGLGALCVAIWWAVVWLSLVSWSLLRKGWQKFNDFCRDQIDPNWAIDQKTEEVQTEIDKQKRAFESYRKEMTKRIGEGHRLRVSQLQQVSSTLEETERFGKEQLALLTQELSSLIAFAEWQYLSETNKAYHCPHCGRKVFLTKKAANKVVKCPYRECRGRIKVSV